ncbi:MAG: penicillin-binding protein [Clostridia bacterium]|nr:penicillin-binding protein [Clostridia bacterium]
MKLIRKLLWLIFLILIVFGAVAFGYYIAVTKNTALDSEKLLLSDKAVVLYDTQGEQIENVSVSAFRQTVRLSEVPKTTKLAFIDVEDKRFYTHSGFDTKRLIKAAYNNLKTRSFKEGASTISQQLIKNTHLSQKKTLKRKLREWKLTRELERAYSKDEILEKYLNVIYFGHNCFGLNSAARFYFGKDPKELDLADSAILAGLVKSPNNYSPFKNPTNCQKRKESVLNIMYKNGDITQTEKRAAIEKPLPKSPYVSERDLGYLHFVFDELTVLAETHGFTVGGNMEIKTYLDKKLQSQLQSIAQSYTQSDKTLTVLDAHTHGFKACVSTVGAIKRLPGSILKPLLVYAPALEKDFISPATPILDEKINYGGYSPNNFDGKFHGYVSARECVAKSLNVPAVKLLESIGIQTGAKYLEKLGLPVEKDDLSLALALGGMKNGYTLQDLISAYSAFTNGGQFTSGAFIEQIKIDGNVIYTHKPKTARVFSEETSYLITDMLKTATKTGTAKKLRSLPFEIAAKTGTAGTGKGNTDAYALSYTSRDCVGVWLGNAAGGFIDSTGGGTPCNLLLQINEYLSESYTEKIENFKKPKNIASVPLDKISYYDTHTLTLADDLSPSDYRFTEIFKKQAVPKQKSEFFSNPTIISPDLCYQNGKVVISFNEKSSPLYTYKIERYDYATHNTLYCGKFIGEFTDENLTANKNYVYTVTPIYGDRIGKQIVLPTVSTKAGESLPASDQEILEKKWWEE